MEVTILKNSSNTTLSFEIWSEFNIVNLYCRFVSLSNRRSKHSNCFAAPYRVFGKVVLATLKGSLRYTSSRNVLSVCHENAAPFPKMYTITSGVWSQAY